MFQWIRHWDPLDTANQFVLLETAYLDRRENRIWVAQRQTGHGSAQPLFVLVMETGPFIVVTVSKMCSHHFFVHTGRLSKRYACDEVPNE